MRSPDVLEFQSSLVALSALSLNAQLYGEKNEGFIVSCKQYSDFCFVVRRSQDLSRILFSSLINSIRIIPNAIACYL